MLEGSGGLTVNAAMLAILLNCLLVFSNWRFDFKTLCFGF